jgi:hypothetical protein
LTFDNMSKAGMIWCDTLTYVVRASRMHVENVSKFEVHTNTAIITNSIKVITNNRMIVRLAFLIRYYTTKYIKARL